MAPLLARRSKGDRGGVGSDSTELAEVLALPPLPRILDCLTPIFCHLLWRRGQVRLAIKFVRQGTESVTYAV